MQGGRGETSMTKHSHTHVLRVYLHSPTTRFVLFYMFRGSACGTRLLAVVHVHIVELYVVQFGGANAFIMWCCQA